MSKHSPMVIHVIHTGHARRALFRAKTPKMTLEEQQKATAQAFLLTELLDVHATDLDFKEEWQNN